jgi:hypothetical protein
MKAWVALIALMLCGCAGDRDAQLVAHKSDQDRRLDKALDDYGVATGITPAELKTVDDCTKVIADAERRRCFSVFGGERAELPDPAAPRRKAYAAALEQRFLKTGMDVSVIADEGTKLKIRYVLLSRPWIYKLVTETSVMKDARRAGFQTVLFFNGRGDDWTYDLVAGKFVSR